MGASKRTKSEQNTVTATEKSQKNNKNEDFLAKQVEVDDIDSSSESEYSGLEEEEDAPRNFDDAIGAPVVDSDDEEEELNSEEDGEEDDNDENEDDDDEEIKFGDDDDDDDIEEITRPGERRIKHPTNEESDSEDENQKGENTVGKIPMQWYNDLPHIGYSVDGEKIYKPAVGDQLDKFLDQMDNPDFMRTVVDETNMKDVVLNDEEIDIIQRIQKGTFAHKEFVEHQPFEDIYSSNVSIHPMSNAPEPKRRFTPSKWEHKKIMKLVRAIRKGWIVPKAPKAEKPRFYEIWDENDEPMANNPMHMPAPKMKLPGHAESYNPPKEYLLTKEEEEAWDEADEEDRPRNFKPQSFKRLVHVPRYDNFIKERFERCLDLYLCPRTRKLRINADPDSLIPKLPSPKDLQPFPTMCMLVYKGHTKAIRSIDVESSGQFLFSGSDDCTLKVWEIITGRCLKTYTFDEPVLKVSACPSSSVSLVAAAVGNDLVIINPQVGSKEIWESTDLVFSRTADLPKADSKAKSTVAWNITSDVSEDYSKGERLRITHANTVTYIAWHHKGDYCASVTNHHVPVLIHQLSKQRSQSPFAKSPGPVQSVVFHPSRPFFFVATQRYIRMHNLIKQELTKKLVSQVKWISSIDIHPQGDNLIIGSYDKRLCWFDLDLSSKPYKTLRYHNEAIRATRYHRRYPLFASASDDGMVHVFHGRVYNDLLQNPLIVPVKRLGGHERVNRIGVTDLVFHPKQPWLISSGADSTMRLFT